MHITSRYERVVRADAQTQLHRGSGPVLLLSTLSEKVYAHNA
jgi:hypothetical protein